MKKKVLTEIFDNLEKSLYSDMSIRIENNLEDGMYREYLVKKVLEKIVPSKYCIQMDSLLIVIITFQNKWI